MCELDRTALMIEREVDRGVLHAIGEKALLALDALLVSIDITSASFR